MQYLLKLDLQSHIKLHPLTEQPKPGAKTLRLRVRLSRSATAQQRLDLDAHVEALKTAPGMDFLHVDAPGAAPARKETAQLLKQYSYKAELYGLQDRSAEVEAAVFQPWYQALLDMGSIQVRSLICLLYV